MSVLISLTHNPVLFPHPKRRNHNHSVCVGIMCVSARKGIALATFAILFVLVPSSQCQDIIFGDEESPKVGISCPASSLCIPVTSCPSALQNLGELRSRLCGFKRRIPLVCCNDVLNNSTIAQEPTRDGISAPKVHFECGRISSRDLATPPLLPPPPPPPEPTSEGTLIRRRRVVGGRPVSPATLWPWLALLGECNNSTGETEWFCGASLINSRWLVSAVHCFLRRQPNVVRLGEHDYSDANEGARPTDYDIEEVVLHPNHTFPMNYDDISLIRIKGGVDLMGASKPVCLPWGRESKTKVIGRDLLLTGWGATIFGGERSPSLNEVNMTVFEPSVCNDTYSALRSSNLDYPRGIDDTFLCMGHPNGGTSACQGDSGGPLMYRNDKGKYVLAGVVSSGYGCGSQEYPGVHTNLVMEPRLAWIKQVAFS